MRLFLGPEMRQKASITEPARMHLGPGRRWPAFLLRRLPCFRLFLPAGVFLLERDEDIGDKFVAGHAVHPADNLEFVVGELVDPDTAIGFDVQRAVLYGDGVPVRAEARSGEAGPLLPDLGFLETFAERRFLRERGENIAHTFRLG